MLETCMEIPAALRDALVVLYHGRWQVIDRRYPRVGETVLAYALTPGDGRLLVGMYDGRSITNGSETWRQAIIRGVVIGTIPMKAVSGKGVDT